MQASKKLSIIVVNYGAKDHIKSCISSIFSLLENKNFEIIVVNNDKNEDISQVLDVFPKIQIINLGKNVGFGTGINTGAKIARGEWLMFLNPDTQIVTSLNKMFAFFAATPRAGIISPKLITEDGETQKWSAGADPSALRLIGSNIGWTKSKKVWEKREIGEVDWVSGAAMVVKKDLFENIGGFDDNIFMYYEDIDLCKRARAAGKKVFYFPQETVLHLGGRSVENKKKQKADYYKSQDYYFQKHFSQRYSKCIRFLRNIFVKV